MTDAEAWAELAVNCPMCGYPWDEKRCAVCGWAERPRGMRIAACRKLARITANLSDEGAGR